MFPETKPLCAHCTASPAIGVGGRETACSRLGTEVHMCELCRELEDRIDRCQRLRDSTTDELTLEAIATLIESYESEKAKLHPKQSDGELTNPNGRH
jgi:hypothetical protein